MKKTNVFFNSNDTPWPLMSVHKKIQPIRASRLAGKTQYNIYMNVLFYYNKNKKAGQTSEPNGLTLYEENNG